MLDRLSFLFFAGTLALAQGCNADCDNPERLEGHYAVWSNTVQHNPSEIPEGYPVKDIFYNGWSEWTLSFVPGQEAFDLVLDGEPFTAAYTPADDNCNHFALTFRGTYTTSNGTLSDLQWKGDLMYYGSHIGGTWTYASTWENPDTLDSGEIAATGEMTGALSQGGYDTGFGN